MPSSPSFPQRRHPRLASYDYSTPGYYFITICVEKRLPLFGSVKDGSMHLNPAGEMVQQAWTDLVTRHAGVSIDTQIVMPDHVHAIVVLEDVPGRVLSLSDAVHRYKSLTTKRYAHGVREHGWQRFTGTLWQTSYYDHVIRKDEDLYEIRQYITQNPLRWELRRAEREQ